MTNAKKTAVKKVTPTKSVNAVTEAPQEENINISLEQITAGIINTYKTVVVPMDNLIADYSGKVIAVNQDPETKVLTFTLVDAPISSEADEENVE